MGTSASGREPDWTGKGGGQAHHVRSFPAGKARSTKTAGQCLTGSQSHTIHQVLGPQAACAAQRRPAGQTRGTRSTLPTPAPDRALLRQGSDDSAARSHRIPVSQQLPAPLSSEGLQDSQTSTACACYCTSVREWLPLVTSRHPGAARCLPAWLVWKQMLPRLQSTLVPLLHTLQSQDSCTQATQTASTKQ